MPVLVRIPIGRLQLIPRGEQSEDARVRLFISALDSAGGTSDVQQAPVPISIPKAEVAALRQAERAVTETLEHHAHVRLRAAA